MHVDLEALEISVYSTEEDYAWKDIFMSKVTGDFALRMVPKLRDISIVLPPNIKLPPSESHVSSVIIIIN